MWATPPPRFNFGVKCDAAAAVGQLLDRMRDAGVKLVKPLFESEALRCFLCAEPDGHVIEVYWQS